MPAEFFDHPSRRDILRLAADSLPNRVDRVELAPGLMLGHAEKPRAFRGAFSTGKRQRSPPPVSTREAELAKPQKRGIEVSKIRLKSLICLEFDDVPGVLANCPFASAGAVMAGVAGIPARPP